MRKRAGDGIRHVHTVGRTRVGKSFVLLSWFLNALARGMGVGLIDPHGDLFYRVLFHLARAAFYRPELYERVVIINPVHKNWCVGFNPLELWPGEVAERKASFLADVITKIFHDDPAIVVRMRRVMRYSFQALMECGYTLVELPRFLTDRHLRESLLSKGVSRRVRDFWRYEFPKDAREAEVWTASTLHRLDPLVSDPDFRLMFGQQKSTINLREMMDTGKILLVDASKGQLTDEGSRLLGAFLVAQIQQAAMTRVDMPEELRRVFHLYLDEFQTYVSPAISTLLEESGKYKLALTLAHQHLAQLGDGELKASVLSQCSDTVCFAVGEDDAEVLAKKLFRPNLDQAKEQLPSDLLSGRISYRPLAEIWELEKRKLTDLPPRYFWHKGQNTEAVLYRSFDMPNISVPPSLIRRLVDASGLSFALPKHEAHLLIEKRNSTMMSATRHGNANSSQRDVLHD